MICIMVLNLSCFCVKFSSLSHGYIVECWPVLFCFMVYLECSWMPVTQFNMRSVPSGMKLGFTPVAMSVAFDSRCYAWCSHQNTAMNIRIWLVAAWNETIISWCNVNSSMIDTCFCSVSALKRKLMLRRSVNELVDRGIYPRKLMLHVFLMITKVYRYAWPGPWALLVFESRGPLKLQLLALGLWQGHFTCLLSFKCWE